MYIDKFDNITNEHNNTNHRTIKMEPTGVNQSIYIDNIYIYKDPKFEIGDHVGLKKICD